MRLALLCAVAAAVAVPLTLSSVSAGAQQVYKWTDASGRVHYGAKKPENATEALTLDIAPTSATPATPTDSAAEVARIKALSEQMASERQAAEQARQDQTLRALEQEKQQLEKELLKQQLQQEQQRKDAQDSIIIGYPPPYSYPPSYPPYPCLLYTS
ncbi:MAG TPA: hypothetical protein DCS31_01460, partial [Candidatus Competibacteraceae bacterium]|nr:hypothetical protein [Candidatus Competibacteraceae bacterium]